MTKGKELPKKIDGKNGNAVVKTLLGWVFNSTYEPCNKKIKRPLFRADSPMMLLTASSCAICGTSTNGLKFGISSSCVLTPAVISKRTESRGSLLGKKSLWIQCQFVLDSPTINTLFLRLFSSMAMGAGRTTQLLGAGCSDGHNCALMQVMPAATEKQYHCACGESCCSQHSCHCPTLYLTHRRGCRGKTTKCSTGEY